MTWYEDVLIGASLYCIYRTKKPFKDPTKHLKAKKKNPRLSTRKEK
jgi:hypothetical protein